MGCRCCPNMMARSGRTKIANFLPAIENTNAYRAAILVMFSFDDAAGITRESENADENTLKALVFEIFHVIIEE